jgi:tight adherence protein C
VFLLLITGIMLFGAAATLVSRAVALPRMRALERVDQIAAYGFHAQAEEPALQERAFTGGFNSIARALGSFVASRTANLSEAELRRELMSAGLYNLAPLTLMGYRVLAAIALPVVFLWLATSSGMGPALVVLGLPLMLLIGWVLPLTLVRRKARFRLERIDHELPELVDLLVVTVEAGTGFAASMQIAADRFTGPLGDELRLAMQEQAMGLPVDESLVNMLSRAETDGMRSFVRSIRQGEALGVSIGQIMRNLALEMRKRRRAHAEERAQKAPVKILFPLVGLIFPAIFVILLAPAVLGFTSTIGGGS